MVRPFKKSDLKNCVKLLIDVYYDEPWKNKWTVKTGTRYLDEISDYKRFVGFVFEDDKTGEIICAVFANEQVWWSGDELYIYELFDSNKHHKKGIGKQLISAIENHVQENNLEGLTLLTNNTTPAPDFYKHLGFEELGHVEYYCRDRLNQTALAVLIDN